MKGQRKRYKVYRDEVKERSTTHWDLDYMTTAELDAAMSVDHDPKHSESGSAPKATRGLTGWVKRLLVTKPAKSLS